MARNSLLLLLALAALAASASARRSLRGYGSDLEDIYDSDSMFMPGWVLSGLSGQELALVTQLAERCDEFIDDDDFDQCASVLTGSSCSSRCKSALSALASQESCAKLVQYLPKSINYGGKSISDIVGALNTACGVTLPTAGSAITSADLSTDVANLKCRLNDLELDNDYSEVSLVLNLLDEADVDDIGYLPSNVTLFLPTNEAVVKALEALVPELASVSTDDYDDYVKARPELLQKLAAVVLYHILPGSWENARLGAAGKVNTVLGAVKGSSLPLAFDSKGTSVTDLAKNTVSLGKSTKICGSIVYVVKQLLLPGAPSSLPTVTYADVSKLLKAN